jgi:hypothetical protein
MPAKKTAKKAIATPKADAAPAAKKAAPASKTSKKTAKAPVRPPLDAIARAAYLNYRRRVEQDLPGDSHGDWLEAEKQLSQS